MNHQPPKLAIRFFQAFCRQDLKDAVLGDLIELFDRRVERNGHVHAKVMFWVNVLTFIQPFAIKRRSNNRQLGTLEIWWLNFGFFLKSSKRNKGFTVLNILGLAAGFAVFAYLMAYQQFENSFDEHHLNRDRIYRVAGQKIQNGTPAKAKASTSVALADPLRNEFPEIESVVRIHALDAERKIFRVKSQGNEKTIVETEGYHAEEDYFRIFSDQLIAGNPGTALVEPNSIVLTESMAHRLFDTDDVVGRSLTMTDDFEMSYQVTGVVADVPANSHFQYQFLVSFSTFQKQRPNWRWNAWDWDYFHTYFLAKEGINANLLESKINSTVAQLGKEVFERSGYQMEYTLQPLSGIHLQSNLEREFMSPGDGSMLKYLVMVGAFVLLLAWINYINLSTARSVLRGKEVGVKKVLGADRKTLFLQFISESFFLSGLALLAGLGLVWLGESYLNTITGFDLKWSYLVQAEFLIWVLGIYLIGSLLAGIYPALVLSGLAPDTILKGTLKSSTRGIQLRRGLIVFQLVIAIFFAVGTFVVYRQLTFIHEKDFGIDMDQVLVINAPNVREAGYWNDYDLLRNELMGLSSVDEVTTSNVIPGRYLNHVELYKRGEQSREEAQIAKHIWIDNDYLDLLDLDLVSGRNLDIRNQAGLERKVMINESMARQMGWSGDEAVGKSMTWVHSWGDMSDLMVVGVVRDYQQQAQELPEPMVFIPNRSFPRWFEANYIMAKISSDRITKTLEQMEDVYRKAFPRDAFDAFFLDTYFEEQHAAHKRLGSLIGLSTLLALLISNMGLLGMTSFVVMQRLKEVSIRKVLGANSRSIVGFFTGQYLLPIAMSLVIAIPSVIWVMQQWLNQFEYRVEVLTMGMVIPVASVVLISLIVIVSQTLNAALDKPIAYLKNE